MAVAPSVSGVCTKPGATALTRMPRGPSSRAATWVSIDNPAFAAQYALIPIAGWRAFSEVSDTTDPPSPRWWPACLSTRNPPVRHTSTTERNCSASRSVIIPKPLKPAQFTTTSRRPSRAATPSNRAATLASSVTSTAAEACPSSAARCAARSVLRSAIVTRAPSAASSCAVAQPIPEAPPTTTATRAVTPLGLLMGIILPQ